MKFLTNAEKLKTTRKALKMNQQDLTDENITRGLISMIEIGKRDITNNVAEKVSDKLQRRADELGIKLKIDKDFLLRSPSEDAELYCLKKLDETNDEQEIKEILTIADSFELENIKALGYRKYGEYYFSIKNYNEAFIMYNDALDIYKNIKKSETAVIYLKMAYCKAMLLQYDEALSFFSLANKYSIMFRNREIENRTTYNIAKCYLMLKRIDLALENIRKFFNSCNKEDDYEYFIYANILKANCYEDWGAYDTAIDIYKKVLDEGIEKTNPSLGYIYNNLGVDFLNENDYGNSLKYFNMAEQLKKSIDPSNVCHTIIEKSDVYIKQGQYNEAIELLKEGLMQAHSSKDYEYLIKGHYKLINIYEITSDLENLKYTYEKIISFLTETNMYNELVAVYTRLSIIHLKENNIDEVNKYLKMSLEINRKCCKGDV